ncbi:TPA: hypothetical protein ACX6RM_001814 [Photobacterium damselae]
MGVWYINGLLIAFLNLFNSAQAGTFSPEILNFGKETTIHNRLITIDGDPVEWSQLSPHQYKQLELKALLLSLRVLSYIEKHQYHHEKAPFFVNKFAFLIKHKKTNPHFRSRSLFLLVDLKPRLIGQYPHYQLHDFQAIIKVISDEQGRMRAMPLNKRFQEITSFLYPIVSQSYSDNTHHYIEISLYKSALRFPKVKNPHYVVHPETKQGFCVDKSKNKQWQCQPYIDDLTAEAVVMVAMPNGTLVEFP